MTEKRNTASLCARTWEKRVRLGIGEGRAAGEIGEGGVADVLEVGDADFAGVESVAGKAADEGEEGDTLAEGGVGLGVFAEGEEIEDGFFLLGGAIQIGGGVAVGAEAVKPKETAAKFELILGVFAGEEVDEFRCAGFDGAAGLIVFGDDGFAK